MVNLYGSVVFIHIFFSLMYMLSHGASATVAFRLRRESNPERIRALLDLSASPEELDKLLKSGKPHLMTVIGLGGWAIILWLMIFKPF